MGEKRYGAIQDTVPSNLPQVYYVDSNRSVYQDEESVNVKDFFIGALVGGIVGAAAGLLLAPKAGRELRGDVATQAVNLKEKTVELSAAAKEKTAHLSTTTAEKTSQLTQQLKEQSTHLVDKVKSKTSKEPAIIDDGTVSSEGEEPLEAIVETVLADATAGIEEVAEAVQEALEEGQDISEASKPSSI